MWKFIKRIPGLIIRFAAVIGMVGMGLGFLSTQISPEKFVYLALFGLSYPFWLAMALFGLLYAIIRKRWKMAILTSVVLIVTGDLSLSTVGIGHQGCPDCYDEDQNVLRVMTYNVRIFDLYNWGSGAQTRDKIFTFLQDHPVDVLAFQEFYHTDREGVFETRDTLITFLDNRYFHERYTHEMHGKQYFGVATFSKYPIVGKGEIAFESDVNNFCIYTDIKKGEDTVRVYNAHLASIRFQKEDYQAIDKGPDQKEARRLADRLLGAYKRRASQVDVIAESIESSPYKAIMCGDFNDTPVSYAYRRMTRNLKDAFRGNYTGFGGTHIGLFPFLRIDFIFADAQMTPHYFKLHHEFEDSDHHPLEVHLSW